jgi:hypothetical protein
MAYTNRHVTGAAKPGEPNDRPPAPARPPPPRWRMWLLPVGIFITLILFLVPHTVGRVRTDAEAIDRSGMDLRDAHKGTRERVMFALVMPHTLSLSGSGKLRAAAVYVNSSPLG